MIFYPLNFSKRVTMELQALEKKSTDTKALEKTCSIPPISTRIARACECEIN